MKKWLSWCVVGFFALWVASTLRPAREKGEFNTKAFGKLPVLLNGRVQPFDSVARNSLVVIHGKQSLYLEEKQFWEFWKHPPKLEAMEWLLEAMTQSEAADARKVFRIDNPELKGLLKLSSEEKFFSFTELKGQWEEVERQAKRIGAIEAEARTPFEKQLMKLHFGLGLYFRLKNSLRPETSPEFPTELEMYQKSMVPAMAAFQKRQAGEAHNEEDLQMMAQFLKRYEMLSQVAYPKIIPPTEPAKSRDDWKNIGESLMLGMRSAAVMQYAQMAAAYGGKKSAEFNSLVAKYGEWLKTDFTPEIEKGKREAYFNHWRPFAKSIALYLVAFLFGCAYWFRWSQWLRLSAVQVAFLAMLVHTGGLVFRMVLEGRPPVTNLYSSAIFVGWGAVVLGIILEKFFKDGIGTVTASLVGFITLVIAHNLSLDGDTMEMLRAVLDTNFWLATHVVVITLGYASMFLGGFLAIIYILRGVLSKTLSAQTARSLYRMVYAITCFSTLFSFVGTILGGIWADQSWGRFWGWDPKENGALLIVIWCAVMLHARWGGLVRERGFMALSVFGNIVTSFSWFGVNMLGVGLHSYGFMDKAFNWLVAFNVSQLLLIAIAFIPNRFWRSFDALKTLNSPASGKKSEPPLSGGQTQPAGA